METEIQKGVLNMKCNRCGKAFSINRHSITAYMFTHIDDDITGNYEVQCPKCKKTYYIDFIAEITHYHIYNGADN